MYSFRSSKKSRNKFRINSKNFLSLSLSLENILLQSLTEHPKFKITQLPVPTERNLSSSTPLVIIKQTVVKPLPCKQT